MPQFESELYQIPNLERESLEIAQSAEDAERIIRVASELSSLGIVARQFPQTEQGYIWAKNFISGRSRLLSYPKAGWQVGHVAALSEIAAYAATFPVTRAFDVGLPVFRVTATENPDLVPFNSRLAEARRET